MEEDKFKWEGNGAKAEEFKKLYKQAEAYDVGFEAGKQQARAEVIEQVKNIIEPYIRDSVLPQVLEELNKLERGA